MLALPDLVGFAEEFREPGQAVIHPERFAAALGRISPGMLGKVRPGGLQDCAHDPAQARAPVLLPYPTDRQCFQARRRP